MITFISSRSTAQKRYNYLPTRLAFSRCSGSTAVLLLALLLVSFTLPAAAEITVLKTFNASDENGYSPYYGALARGMTNEFYGIAGHGGVSDKGTVYEYDPAAQGNEFTVLHKFGSVANDGTNPHSCPIMVGSDLYGTAKVGGSSGHGTIYKIVDLEGMSGGPTYSVAFDFSGGTGGSNPIGAPTYDVMNSALYGTTQYGGTDNKGLIYKVADFDTVPIYTYLHLFAGGADDGRNPWGTLVIDDMHDVLYGTTRNGGDNDQGTVFKIDIDGNNFTLLHDFNDGSVTNDGQDPAAGLTLDTVNSVLYGTTYSGGSGGYGVIFKIANISGTPTYSILHHFTGGSDDGKNPMAPVLLNESTLYGTAAKGGDNGDMGGVVFKIGTDGSGYRNLHEFSDTDGRTPQMGLTLGTDDYLYGATSSGGGTNNYGVLYKTLLNTAPVAGFGNALSFDGTEEYISAGDNLTMSLGGSTDFSITAWVRPAAFSGNNYPVFVRPGNMTGDLDILTMIDGGGAPRFGLSKVDSGSWSWCIAASAITAETWTHLAFVKSGNDLKIYIDGTLDQTTSITGQDALSANEGDGNKYIGANLANGDYFSGKMDEVQVWTTALTAEQIQAWMYRAPDTSHPSYDTGGGTNYLAAYWPFDQVQDMGGEYSTSDPVEFNEGTMNNMDTNNQSTSTVKEWSTDTATPVTGSLPGGDTNGTSDSGTDWKSGLTFSIVSQGSMGTVAIGTGSPPNTFTYTPSGSETGQDSFTYKLNDGLEDSNTATVYVTVTEVANQTPVAGFGTALDFDGENDYIQIPDNESLHLTGSFTMEFWFKSGDVSQNNTYLISKNAGNGDQWAVIYEYRDNKIELTAANGGIIGTSPRDYSAITVNDTDWHHVTYTYDQTTLKGYLDGTLVLSETVSFTLTALTGVPLYLGCSTPSAGNYVDGSMDEIRIWDTALPQEQIQNWMYRSVDQTHPAVGNMVAYYTFNEGSGTTVADPVNGNNGTLTNMAEEDWITSTAGSEWTATENTPLFGYLVGSDQDGTSSATADWLSAITFEIVDYPDKAEVKLGAGNSFIFTPNVAQSGAVSFTYRVSDGTAESAKGTVGVTIEAVNDTPVAGFGNALDFDGTDDYVDVGTLDGLSGAVSVEAWVKFDEMARYDRIVDFGQGEADDNILVYVGQYNGIVFQIRVGAEYHLIETASTLETACWYHVAAVTDGTNGSVFINGEPQPLALRDVNGTVTTFNDGRTSATLTGATDVGSRQSCFIGRSNWTGPACFDGQMDEVRIWNTALTQEQIQAWMYREGDISHPAGMTLAGYWKFNESGGLTAYDYTGEANHGTLVNMDAGHRADPASADAFGEALQFDGVDDRVQLAGGALNNLDAFTLSFRLKTAHASADRHFFSAANSSQYNEILIGLTLGSPQILVKGSAYDPNVTAVNDGQWHQVAVTRSESTVKCYIDGILDFTWTEAPTGTLSVDTGGLWLGGDQDSVGGGWSESQQFHGFLDDVQIWNAALDQGTIRDWMDYEIDSSHPNYDNLVAYYQFDEGSGTTVTDSKGSYDGTLSNMEEAADWVSSTIADSFSTTEDNAVSGHLVGSDDDGTSDSGTDWLNTVTFSIVSAGSKGTAEITADNSFTYTPTSNENGSDTFTYKVNDGTQDSSTRTVSVSISAVNDAPTGSVTISGTPTEDQTLTAGNTLADDDGMGNVSYQWKRGGNVIDGATNDTYSLGDDDVGAAITVTASYTDGNSTAESVTSSPTSAITNVNDNPTGTVTISGTAMAGQILTSITSEIADLDGLGTFSYQWKRGGDPIDGATDGTYTLVEDDVGSTITVTASYTDGNGTPESVTSAPTAEVAPANLPPTAGFGSALEFDGVNDFVSANMGTGTFSSQVTMEFWVNYHDLVGQQNLARLSNTEGSAIRFVPYKTTGNKLAFYLANGTGSTAVVTDFSVAAGTWYHCTFTYDGTTAGVYVNGSLADSQEYSGMVMSNVSQGLDIGADDGSYYTKASIDEVRIWDTALTAEQIRAWMYREIDLTHPAIGNLISYYSFNEGSGTTAADTVNGNDGTLTDMAEDDWIASAAGSQWTVAGTPLIGTMVGSDQDGTSISGTDWNSDITFSIVSQPEKGTVSVGSGNHFIYAPAPYVTGIDSFEYRLNDGTIDSNTGTVTITIGEAGDPPVAGFGEVLDFDGVNDYVDVGTLDGFSDAVSVEAWVKFNSFVGPGNKGYMRIIGFGQGADNDNVMLTIVGTSGQPGFELYQGGARHGIRTSTVLNTGEWYHLAAVTDGTNGSIFINGIAQPLSLKVVADVFTSLDGGPTSAECVGASDVSRTSSFIGRSNWSGDAYADAQMDEVRVWNTALTQEQIQAWIYREVDTTHPAVQNLVGYWKFDEGGGTIADDYSGNGNHGTLVNMAAGYRAVSATAGSFGQALAFDGVNDRVRLAETALDELDSFSVSFTFKTFDTREFHHFISAANASTVNEFIVALNNGSLRLYLGGTRHDPTTFTMHDGDWHRLTVTRSGNTVRSYTDGILIDTWSGAPTGAVSVSANGLWLGGDQDSIGGGWESSQQFCGILDDVQIWNTALDQSTIQEWLYIEIDSSHPNYANLVAYYRFEEESGTTVIDSKGPYHGTLHNMEEGTDRVESTVAAAITTSEDNPVSGSLVGSDDDGTSDSGTDWLDTVTFSIVSSGSKGTAAITTDNNFTYTPATNENGVDSFTYKVNDGSQDSNTRTINVTISAVNDLPTGSVTITGDATEDVELQAGNTLADDDGLGEISYQWKRGGSAIDGATGNTYTLGDDDVGAVITVTASYTDGHETTESVTSSATSAVANVNDDPAGSVSITGDAVEDATLTADTSGLSDDDGLGDFSYQWQVSEDGSSNWSTISGANSLTFQPGDDQVGMYLSVVVSYTDGHETAESVTSGATGQISNVNDAPSDIALSSTTLDKNQGIGAAVGTFTSSDPDMGDTHGYTLVSGDGSTNNGLFTIEGDVLKTATSFSGYSDGSTVSIRVRSTDNGSPVQYREEAFTLTVASVTISNLSNFSATEQQNAVTADNDVSITGGSNYADGYLWFKLGGETGTETLALTSSGNPTGNGEISVSGSSIYLGTGSGTAKIGEVDATYNGQNGQDLKILFSTPLSNTGFESGTTTGWTINTSYGGRPGDTHSSISQYASVVSEDKSEGTYSLKLEITGGVSVGYGTAHGPQAESSYFEASQGDIIAVDWRAAQTSDDYDVYGFLVDDNTGGTEYQLFYSRGQSRPWGTTETTVPVTSDKLKFRFLCGTYDRSGGLAVGSYMYVDNIRVFSSDVNDTVITKIARQVTYHDSSDTPAESKTLQVEVLTYNGALGTESLTITTSKVNDSPAGAVTIDGSAVEDQTLTVNISGLTDADGLGTLSYQWQVSADGSTGWTAVDGATTSSFQPGDNQVGKYLRAVITYTDGEGTGETVHSSTTAAIQNINDTPTVEAVIGNRSTDEDVNINVDLAAVFDDADIAAVGDSLALTVQANTNSLLFDSTNITETTLTLDLAANQNGTADITVRATDTAQAYIEDTFTVTVADVNDAPSVASQLANVNLDEDAANEPVSLTGAFSDVDIVTNSDSLQLAVSGNTTPSLFDSVTITDETLTIDLSQHQNGSSDITVMATDTFGVTVEQTFTVTVAAVNDNPAVANAITDVNLDEDDASESFSVAAVFGDADIATNSDSLLLTVEGNTNSSLFDSVSINGGLLVLDLAQHQNGSADITVRATDTVQAYIEDTFSVTVGAVNDTPTVAGQLGDVNLEEDAANEPVELASAFGDVDIATNSDLLVLTVSGNTNTSLFDELTIDGEMLTIDLAQHQNGTADITVRVTDTFGATVEQSFGVTVAAVNDIPVVAGQIAGVVLDEDAANEPVILTGMFDDADIATNSDSLVLTVSGNTNLSLFDGVTIAGETLTIDLAQHQNGIADIIVRATDTLGATVEQTFGITIEAVNDAPVVAVNTGATTTEGGSVIITPLMLEEGDVDDNGTGLVYTVTQTVTTPDSSLKLNGVPVNNNDIFTQDDIDNYRLVFQHGGGEQTADSFSFTLADGGEDGAGTVPGSFSFTVNPVNDAPTITAGGTLAYTGGEAPSLIDTSITLADTDDTTLAGATVTISRNFQPGEDMLDVQAPSGITSSFDGSLGVLTLSNISSPVSLSDYQDALQSVTYFNQNSDNPSVVPRTVTFTINDGLLLASARATVYVSDLAPPRIVGLDPVDDNGNGRLEKVVFTFSEPLKEGGEDISDWVLIDADGQTDLLDGLEDSAVSISGRTLIITLNDTAGTDGPPLYAYRDDGRGGRLKDAVSNRLTDVIVASNHPPVADAGEDQETEPVLIWLDGTGSTDEDKHLLYYEWTQTDGPISLGITGATDGRISFPGRAVGIYDFTLEVEDGLGASSSDNVSVTILNREPTSNAGRDRSVVKDENTDLDMTLDGSRSSDGNSYTDPDDYSWHSDIDLYSWEQVEGPAEVELIDLETVQPLGETGNPVAAPVVVFDTSVLPGGRYSFRLTVTDQSNTTDTDDIVITIFDPYANTAPTADAGGDITVFTGTSVTLSGHESKDSDGDDLTYNWAFESGPYSVQFSDTTAVQPSFTPTLPGTYVFELTVHDDEDPSLPDQVQVLAVEPEQEYPVADIRILGTVQSAWQSTVGEDTVLQGNVLGVDDPSTVAFSWSQLEGLAVSIVDNTVQDLTVSPVEAGVYLFKLDVSKGDFTGDPAYVYITVIGETEPPVADAGDDLTDEEVGVQVSLDGSGSSDTDGDDLTYTWVQVDGPTVILYDADTVSPSFTPPVTETYQFQMVAFDGTYDSLPDLVNVVANSEDSHVPVAVIVEKEVTKTIGQPIMISGLNSFDVDNADSLSFLWVQKSGPKVVLDDPTSPYLSFTPTYPGIYVFELTVDDSRPQSLGDDIAITVGEPGSSAVTGDKGSGCFIATTAFGTPMAEEIEVLRNFRDRYLLGTSPGRSLVDCYYRYSPPLARKIQQDAHLKHHVRTWLSPAIRGLEIVNP